MLLAIIYGLYDPRFPDDIRYVGQTVQLLETRLKDHIKIINDPNSKSKCDEWVRVLLSEGVRPIARCLETVDEKLVHEIEWNWIKEGLTQGWDLLNEGTGRTPIPWDSSLYLTPQFLDRFWNGVNKNAPNECWEWTRYKNHKGYGQTNIGSKKDHTNRRIYVHRLSWELSHGPIPHHLFVCHQCDNPACVNPNHLFLDTGSGNMKDASAKGRIRNQFSDKDPVTHCHEGHPYSLTSKGKKYCKVCNVETMRIRRQEERQRLGLPPARPFRDRVECPQGHPYDEENTMHVVIQGRPARMCRACHRIQGRINAQNYRERKRLAQANL